jgi:hypothetical protein
VANFRIYHSNRVDDAILSGGDWGAVASLEYMRDPRPTRRARSTDLQLGSTKFTMAFTEPLNTYGVQIIATNLSAGAKYRITWFSDAGFTMQSGTSGWVDVGSVIDWTDTDDWLDWLDTDFWLGYSSFIDPDNYGKDIRHIFNAITPLQYVLVEFDDTNNPDGYIEVGHAFFGEAYIPSINIDYEPSFVRLSRTSVQEAVSGAAYFSRRGSQREMSIAWSALPDAEVMVTIDNIIYIHDINKPVFVDFDSEDTSSVGSKRAFLARISQMPEIRLVQVFFDNDAAASLGFTFTQVL